MRVSELTLITKTMQLSRFPIAEKYDWQLPQELSALSELGALKLSDQQPYGFLNRHSGYFRHVQHTENEVNELSGEAESLSPEERRVKREAHEDKKWDPDYYMCVLHFHVHALLVHS